MFKFGGSSGTLQLQQELERVNSDKSDKGPGQEEIDQTHPPGLVSQNTRRSSKTATVKNRKKIRR